MVKKTICINNIIHLYIYILIEYIVAVTTVSCLTFNLQVLSPVSALHEQADKCNRKNNGHAKVKLKMEKSRHDS